MKFIYKYNLKGDKNFSNDHLKDLKVCQELYKQLDTASKHLKGFIQAINYSPFGFLMQSETQVIIV